MSQGSDRYDATLPRATRRATGAYYTPDDVVQYIVGETLTADLWQSSAPRILDPACGDGAFLCEVAKRVVEHGGSITRSLFGIDCDVVAVEQARRNVARSVLGKAAGEQAVSALAAKLKRNLIVADALLDPLPRKWPRAFDAIVGNPPYVNIRRIEPALAQTYRQGFRCARGCFDLYVLFIERSLELLRDGGRCGLIVPNKLATLDYAAECRTMLVDRTTLETIADLSAAKVFCGASVYPHVVVFERTPPKKKHAVRIVQATRVVKSIPQTQLHRRGVFSWEDALDVEQRVETRTLGDLCALHSGTTGFAAQEIAAELGESCSTRIDAFPFITSGNIDRYRLQLGDVRYMKRRFREPVLSSESDLLTPAKRRLFAEPKIVIAGMSRRLEAAWHAGPLALGVQVFAAAECTIDPLYLLALLNSRLLSHLFRTRFAAKQLGGGYLSINKGQLSQLPIAVGEPALVREVAALGKRLSQRGSHPALEDQVDRLVYGLYGLRPHEIAAVEQAASLLTKDRLKLAA